MRTEDRHHSGFGAGGQVVDNVVRTAREPMVALNTDWAVVSANEPFLRVFGVSMNDVRGQGVFELGEGELDVPQFRRLLEQELSEKQEVRDVPVAGEFPRLGERTLVLNARRLAVDGSELILLAIENLTIWRGQEETLHETQEKFRLVIQSAVEYAIFTTDLEGRITSWNSGAQRLLGYEEMEVLGRGLDLLFTEKDIEGGAVEHEIRMALEEGRAQDNRWHVRKDEQRLWVDGSLMPLHDDRGETHGFLKIMRDITAQRRAQEQQEAWMKTLEERVESRTEEVRMRVEQLQRLAWQLSQAEQRERQRLARLLHDDLQQLLVAARLQVQSLGTEDMVERVLQILNRAINASRDLSYELSPPVLQEQGLAAALHWLGEHVERQYQLPVEVATDNGTSEALSVEMQGFLFQSVRELLFNVVKHAQATQAWVTTSLEHEQVLRITVEDNGQGCDADAMLKKGGGGFGLMSIRERLEVWDGRLEVGARSDGGCHVTLELPWRVAVVAGQATPGEDREEAS